jgi:glycosyltransferase involved in cell wall biosynthesis
MRILIASDIFPPDAGGPATYVPLVARELQQRGHTVRVLTYSRVERDRLAEEYPFQVERIVLHGPRPFRLLRAFQRIAAGARQADVLYVNGLLIETALVNWFLRKPMVAKVVGDIVWERARDKAWIEDQFEELQERRYAWRIELRRALRNWALRQARAVIVPSAYLQRIVTGWGIDAQRTHVIYNALEFAASHGEPEALPLSTKQRVITICRLTGWKGVDSLIEAVGSLPDTGLVIVGEGPERPKLEALVRRLGVGRRVHFAGQIAQERVGAYLAACDLFVLNSRYEGLPHVVLEAMAAGLPVVATDVGGIGEVLQPGVNGKLIQPAEGPGTYRGDAASLRQAMVEVLQDTSLRQRCAAGKEDARRRFSPHTMAEAVERVLQQAKGQ